MHRTHTEALSACARSHPASTASWPSSATNGTRRTVARLCRRRSCSRAMTWRRTNFPRLSRGDGTSGRTGDRAPSRSSASACVDSMTRCCRAAGWWAGPRSAWSAEARSAWGSLRGAWRSAASSPKGQPFAPYPRERLYDDRCVVAASPDTPPRGECARPPDHSRTSSSTSWSPPPCGRSPTYGSRSSRSCFPGSGPTWSGTPLADHVFGEWLRALLLDVATDL